MGCLCVQAMVDYDKAYFRKLVGFAEKCDGVTLVYDPEIMENASAVDFEACPTPLPKNGFAAYDDAQAVKDAVQAMTPRAGSVLELHEADQT